MVSRMTAIADGFSKWNAEHKTGPCPTTKDLEPFVGGAAKLQDSWGHPVQITCTDQPGQQIIGIISAGPDGTIGNRDDVVSWSIAAASDMLGGPRWVAKPVRPRPTGTRPTTTGGTQPRPTGTQPTGAQPTGDPDIPDKRAK